MNGINKAAVGGLLLLCAVSQAWAGAIDTRVTLSGGILTITDDSTATDDDLTISYAAGIYTVSDSGAVVIDSAVAGSTGSGTNSVTVPDTGVAGLRFVLNDGDDAVTITSVQASLTDEFSVVGGMGADSVTLNAALTTPTTVTLDVEAIALGNDISSSGQQVYAGAVTLATDVTLTSGAGMAFNGTLDGAQALVLDAATLITFNDELGGITPLGSTDGIAGTIDFGGGLFRTTGAQSYNSRANGVRLVADATFESIGNDQISFPKAVFSFSGTHNLVITGHADFGFHVGLSQGSVFRHFASVTVNGASSFNQPTQVLTTGPQTFNGPVGVALGRTFRSDGGGDITFNSTFDKNASPGDATIFTTGNVHFAGTVGGITALDNLTLGGGAFVVNDVSFDSAVTVVGALAQIAGAGTTTFNGVSAGSLALTTANVVSAGGALDYAGTATLVTDLTLALGSQLPVALNGATPGVDFDQLSVTGTVDLGGATLDLSVMAGFTPTVGDEFVLIDNDVADPVIGSFANGVLMVDGINYVASTSGGDGNDVALIVVGMPAGALVVDTLADESDGNFGPGDLSLREALQLANLDPDLSAVTFHPALTGGGPATITLTLGEMTVTESATITGPGQTLLTISGNNASRIINVDNGDDGDLRDVAVSELSFINGQGVGNTVAGHGGAISSNENLTLTNVTFTGNNSDLDGGAVRQFLGLITIDGATLRGNTAVRSGGAISINDADVILRNSSVSMNAAGDDGGGVGMILSNAQFLATVENVVFDTNNANDDGGGIFKSGQSSMEIRSSTFIDNSCGDDGAGSYLAGGSGIVEDSTFAANVSGGEGSGIYFIVGSLTLRRSLLDDNTSNGSIRGGGGAYFQSANVRVEESLISNNTATNRLGGGIMKLSGSLVVLNSTISGNFAGLDGGGIYSQSGATAIVNSTIVLNTAADDGGGISRGSNGTPILRNSIVSGNNAGDEGDEIWGVMTADGNNLLGRNNRDNAQAFDNGFTPGPSDITATNNGTNPASTASMIDTTLADNGGPTFTHLLQPGSLAIDAGNGTLATSDGTVSGTPLATDQRLLPRFFGSGVDIGAVQLMGATTEVTLVGGIATITDAAGGTSTDSLAISYAGGTYTVVDGGGLNIRNDAIAGASGSGTNTATFPDTGVTGVRFDTLAGDDTVVLVSLPASLPDGLVVADSNDTDRTIIDGALDIGGGLIQIDSDTVQLDADLTTTGGQQIGSSVALSGTRVLTGGSVFIASTVNSQQSMGILKADFSTGEIKLFDDSGAVMRTFRAGLNGPRELARDSEGMIYVVEQHSGQVQRLTAQGKALGVFISDLQMPYGIAIDGAGQVYVSEPEQGRVLRFDHDGKLLGVFHEGLPGVSGIDVADVFGEERIAMVYANHAQTFALDGSSRLRISDTQVSELSSIKLLDDGSMLLLAERTSHKHLSVDGRVSIDQSRTPHVDGLPIALPSGALASLTINATAGDATIAGSVGNLDQLSALSLNATGTATLVGADIEVLNIAAAAFSLPAGTLDFEQAASIAAASTAGSFSTLQFDIAGAQFNQIALTGTQDLGLATLQVTKDPAFNPAPGDEFVIIDNDGVDPVSNRFASSLVSSNGTEFVVFYAGGDGNDVVLCVTGPGVCPVPGAAVTLTESGGNTGVAEGGAGDSYDVVLDVEPYATVSVNLTVSAGLQVTPTTLSFGPLDWMTTQQVSVSAIDDRTVEGDESVAINHANSGGGYDTVMTADVSVGITDNDSATYGFGSPSSMVAESVGTVMIPVLVDFDTPGTGPQAFVSAFTIPISIDPASTANAMDFVSVPSSILMPADGSSQSVTLTVIDDNFSEPDESLIMVLGDETGGTPGQQAAVTVGPQPEHVFVILDDDTIADLAVSNVLMPAEALPGTTVSFDITVNNLSITADVPQAAFAFVLDAPLDNIQWTCIAEANATCPANGSGVPAHDISLGRSTGVMYTLTATVPAGAAPGEQFVADANVAIAVPQIDPNGANDTDQATLTVQGFMIFADGFESP